MSDSESNQKRSAEDIQAEIEETRRRLADNLEQLKAETAPKALLDKAKARVTGVFVDHETGELRKERVAAVVGGVVALIVIRRGFKARAHRKELERLSQVVWVPVPRTSVNPEYAGMARTARELAPAPVLPALPSAG